MHWTKVSLPSQASSMFYIGYLTACSLSSIEQKIVLSLFVRRFNPGIVLEKNINLVEAVTAVPDETLDILVELSTE